MTGVEAVSNGVTRVSRAGRCATRSGRSRPSSASSSCCWPASPTSRGPTTSARPSPARPAIRACCRSWSPRWSDAARSTTSASRSILVVLALSANTGFADFPRLCRLIAQDGFLPRVFASRGRRLVYSLRHLRADRPVGVSADHLRRHHRSADSALRRRRVPRVHALAGGHGRALAGASAAGHGRAACWSTASARSRPASRWSSCSSRSSPKARGS